LAHAVRHHRLDRCGRAHGHKGRRANFAARRGNNARTGLAISGIQGEFEFLCHTPHVKQLDQKAKGKFSILLLQAF